MKNLIGLIKTSVLITAMTSVFSCHLFLNPVGQPKENFQGERAGQITFTPPAGTYTGAQNISLTIASPGNTTIYYTLDGSTPAFSYSGRPMDNTLQYKDFIPVSNNLTISAIAKVTGYRVSEIYTAQYVIQTVIYVAVGDGGTANSGIWRSTDAISWTNVSPGGGGILFGAAFGNGRFVAVGNDGAGGAQIWYSDNGSTWTNASPGGPVLSCVAYGNSRFVAAGLTGALYWSLDGAVWNSSPVGAATNRTIVYGDSRFVMVNENSGSY